MAKSDARPRLTCYTCDRTDVPLIRRDISGFDYCRHCAPFVQTAHEVLSIAMRRGWGICHPTPESVRWD
jgi:hypothetical protein